MKRFDQKQAFFERHIDEDVILTWPEPFEGFVHFFAFARSEFHPADKQAVEKRQVGYLKPFCCFFNLSFMT